MVVTCHALILKHQTCSCLVTGKEEAVELIFNIVSQTKFHVSWSCKAEIQNKICKVQLKLCRLVDLEISRNVVDKMSV